MRNQRNMAVTWLSVLVFLLLWCALLYFDITDGLAGKPVSTLPSIYWVLLISALLVTTVVLVGVELGLIPKWRDNSGSRFATPGLFIFTGAVLAASSILYGRSNWENWRVQIAILGWYSLLVGAVLFIHALLKRSEKLVDTNGPGLSGKEP